MRLLKNIIKFCPILFLIYCSKNEQFINNIDKDSITNINKGNYSPVFLGLSPNMTDKEYDLQIKKLNKDGILEGNDFTINDNNKLYVFNVSKTSKSIRLEFNDFVTVITTPNENVSQESNSNYELEKNQIQKVFNKKYKKANIQLPENIDFAKFDFTLNNYTLYKDSDKYVLLGYSMPDVNTNNVVGKSRNSKDEKLFGSDVMTAKSNEFVSYEYGLKIQIDYLEIDDMNKILKQINLEINNEVENKKRQSEIKVKREQSHKNNIKNI